MPLTIVVTVDARHVTLVDAGSELEAAQNDHSHQNLHTTHLHNDVSTFERGVAQP